MSGLEVTSAAARWHVGPGEVEVDEDGTLTRVLREPSPDDRISLGERRLERLAAHRRVAAGLVVVGPAPVASDVSVLDHLAAIEGRADARRRLTDAPLLAGRGADPAGVLSGGERLVLDWLRAQALRPDVVVLAGAGAGLDASTLAWCGSAVAGWLADGVAVVLRPGRPEERRWAGSTGRVR